MLEIWQFQELILKNSIHLITSVPSVETFNNICKKKYRCIKIFKRFNDHPLPESKIINLNINKIKNKFIAKDTADLVQTYLNQGVKFYFF